VRHSRATELRLTLTRTAEGCQASLRDNGVGFDPAAIEGSSHYGLKSMRGRIEKIGGAIRLDTAPGKGTEIKIAVPFNQT
jgi:signal transduction histidine kinase